MKSEDEKSLEELPDVGVDTFESIFGGAVWSTARS